MTGTLSSLINSVLFLWGLAYLGLVAFSFFIATPSHWANLVAEGRIKAEYAVYIRNIPAWVIGITVIVALTRFGGGLALGLSPRLAFPLYLLSFILTVVIMFRGFVLADVASVIRPSQIAVEALFFVLSAFAVWYSFLRSGVQAPS